MKDLEKLVADSDLTEDEIRMILKSKKPALTKKPHHHHFGRSKAKIGVVSDLHVGSQWFSEKAFDASRRKFNSEKVDAIYVPGDIIEGMSGREGHPYTLTHLGVSAQMDYAVDLLNQYKQPIFFITGNHDEWAKKKGDMGVLVGPEIERRVKDATFLGEYEASVYLAPNVRVDLTHRGNSAYALSYSLQKRINALEGGHKPDIILNGHLHKYLHMFYRNINALECGTLQHQTDFLAMKGSPAHVGFSIMDVEFGKKGVTGFNNKWCPVYEK